MTEQQSLEEALPTLSARQAQVFNVMKAGQEKLVDAFTKVDGGGQFKLHSWTRPNQGGGGNARVLEDGTLFERAGVNVSAVLGERVPDSLAKQHEGTAGKPFFATGISMVLHPNNPYVPSFHANYRYFEVGGSDVWWFGGGADLTPNYPIAEDAVHFHKTLKAQCDRHAVADYDTFKTICDDYFYIKHRGEMRGIGGIFFDELEPVGQGDFDTNIAFVKDGINTILDAYFPIIDARRDRSYSEHEREWQLYRRGRYVEFNLVYDRGTLFGLQTGGNIEAILMSMPRHAHWRFDYQPEVGSEEAKMLEFLQPRDWVSN